MDIETKLTVAQIKSKLDVMSENNLQLLDKLKDDPRKSVHKLVENKKKLIEKGKLLLKDHEERLSIERMLKKNPTIQYIAGIDEVGRGPLAGPVVAAAVILPEDCSRLIGVNDSKQLSFAKRKEFDQLIREVAVEYTIAVVDSQAIDRLNIYEATRHAMLESVRQLNVTPDFLLLDAMKINSEVAQKSIIKGDQKSLSIAAASIIAKVYRDEMMMAYAQMYPEFGFDKHMGYGTKQHLEALKTYGFTPIHRQSFSPVTNTLKEYK
ncbi:ribonuclease HII [Fundicoccus sp. Sow4_F4]|uniref:ribonuclease HII n=1 Tax=Fundicoccus sp. Sow4_F4 TaxID=3438783 RepID=UPI003F918BB6